MELATTAESSSYERTINKVSAAFVAAQASFPEIPKDKLVDVGQYSYSYAELGTIISMIKPALKEHGLAIIQSIEQADANTCVLLTSIVHTSGQKLTSGLPFQFKPGLPPQQQGGLITYMKRYGLCLAIGISPEDDLDARDTADEKLKSKSKQAPVNHAPGQAGTISEAQGKLLWVNLQKAGWSEEQAKNFIGIRYKKSSSKDLRTKHLNDFLDILKSGTSYDKAQQLPRPEGLA
jgi:hypothetical protein